MLNRKTSFLASISGKKGYKRYGGSPIRYAGGKSLGVGEIVERIPDNVQLVVSPFIGGGSVEIAIAKELGIPVRAYDLLEPLAVFWDVIVNDTAALYSALAAMKPDETVYEMVRERLKRHWKYGEKLERLDLAAHYWYNHNLSFGPGFLGWMSSNCKCPKRYLRLIKRVRDFKCPLLSVRHGDFKETIPRHSSEFIYADPPYHLSGKMFKGIYPSRNIPVYHNGFDHEALCSLLKAHKGGFLLSYNDCEAIRQLYDGCRIEKVAWNYTMGQGEVRIGKNREAAGHTTKESHEILISNV